VRRYRSWTQQRAAGGVARLIFLIATSVGSAVGARRRGIVVDERLFTCGVLLSGFLIPLGCAFWEREPGAMTSKLIREPLGVSGAALILTLL
jgi:hypothetical protein